MSTPDNELLTQDELATLKARADMLGLSYHPSIGVDKLKEKIAAALASDTPVNAPAAPVVAPNVVTDEPIPAPVPVVETEGQKRKRLREQAARLVRIRLTCMNPAKKDWEGEIFTVGNAGVGTFKKYVPFNNDEGWHVPHIMYEQIRDRMCQVFVTTKTKHGIAMRQGKLIKEFAIEVLPDLSEAELQELAQRQAMSRSVD